MPNNTVISKGRANKSLMTSIKLFFYPFLIYALMFSVSSIVAFVLNISCGYCFVFALILSALSSGTSGFVIGRILRKKGMVFAIVYSAPVNVVIVCISMVLNRFNIDYFTALSFVVLVAFSALGGILAVNVRSKKIVTRRHLK